MQASTSRRTYVVKCPKLTDGGIVQHADSIRALEPDAVVQLNGILPRDHECTILNLQEVDVVADKELATLGARRSLAKASCILKGD